MRTERIGMHRSSAMYKPLSKSWATFVSWVVGVLGIWLPSVSHAELSFCNHTRSDIFIAVAWGNEGVFTRKGWFKAEPGQCVAPIKGNLKERYYYYYAQRADRSIWAGDDDNRKYCIHPTSVFEYKGNDFTCPSEAYTVNFHRIDTGDDLSYEMAFTHRNEPFDVSNPTSRSVACDILNKRFDKSSLRSEHFNLASYTDPFTIPQTRSECTGTYDTGVPDLSTCRAECTREWRTTFPPGRGCMQWHTRCSNVIACNTWKVEKRTMQCDLRFQFKLPNYVERPLSSYVGSTFNLLQNRITSLPLECTPTGQAAPDRVRQIGDAIRERVRSTVEREARQWLQETAIQAIVASIPSGGTGGAAVMSTQAGQFVYRIQKALKPIIKVANDVREFAEDVGFSTSCGWSDWSRM